MDYNLSLVKALNYYSREVENKDKKNYAITYWKKQGKVVAHLSQLHESWFSTVGAVAHLVMHDVPISDFDLERLENAYIQLSGMTKEEEVKEAKSTEPKLSIQDHMDNAAKIHIAEIEGMIDDVISKGEVTDIKQYLTSNQVKGPVVKRVGDWASIKLKEYRAIVSDSEIMEGYSNLGKRGLNKLITFLESVVASCSTMAIVAKTMRAPRKRKEKPPSVLVAKLKWAKEYVELGFKSVHAEKIIMSDTIFLFDFIKRRMIKYVALDGYTLSVKGTTILNWDPEKSGSKIIRKPEVQLNGIQSMGKRQSQNLFNEIKATMSKLNGRTNENCVILSVF